MNFSIVFSRFTGFLWVCLLAIHSSSFAENGYKGMDQDTIKRTGTVRKQPVYVTTRLTTHKPVIDGRLDDEC
jgi:hypothetical protein